MYTTQGAKPTSGKQRDLEENNMISYAEAKRRAQTAKPNWNEYEYIAKAGIYWADAEYEYDTYDDDADFDAEYDNWCEFEWECRTGR